jgi:hypothetical protein
MAIMQNTLMSAKQWTVLGLLVTSLACAAPAYEFAMIKWDGPDKLAVIYADRAEVIRVFRVAKPPPEVSEEEFCLTWGANKLAQDGWEAVNLNSRRILLRRAPKT